MSVTPPVGYGLVAFTHAVSGGTRDQVNVFGFANPTDLDPVGALAGCVIGLQNAGRPYEATFRTASSSIVERYCLVNRTSAGLQSTTSFTTTVGTAGWDAPGPGTSLIINKHTAGAGRRYRGRVAWPSGYLDETEINDAGVYDATALAGLQTIWNTVLAAMTSAHVPMVLLHAPGISAPPVPTLVTSLTVNALTGSQRKRLRR